MQYMKLAQTRGIINFARIDAFNTDPLFIDMLKELVLEQVKEI